MPDLTPTTPFTALEVHAAKLVWSTTEWQDWVGVSLETATARVHEGSGSGDRPFAIVRIAEVGFPHIGSDGFGVGTVELLVVDNVPDQYESDDRNARRYFLNKLGDLVVAMKRLARGPGGYMTLRAPYITLRQVKRSKPKSKTAGAGDFFEAFLELHTGLSVSR